MLLDVRHVRSEAKISAGSSRLMPGGVLLSGLLMHANQKEHASMKSKQDEHQFQLTAQQAKVLNLISLLLGSFEPELLRYIAQRHVAANKLPTCLVLSPDDCLYYEIDGREFHSEGIPWGGHATFGLLRLCVEFENDDELQVRQRLLAAYVDNTTPAA
jgi:hypothetical protein